MPIWVEQLLSSQSVLDQCWEEERYEKSDQLEESASLIVKFQVKCLKPRDWTSEDSEVILNNSGW